MAQVCYLRLVRLFIHPLFFHSTLVLLRSW
ncbi:hypothetical protein PanWU01x14_328080 [Parasponia andersonii]|uniref:Uncharacterized protein n=1 Tax=Parasponia andersonii TaxID=3476 RepID=A0A2P5AIQ5_PARAD|nr:hypothetical protein PanWU01x14_328080 [Parasponia andersonii]